MRLWKAGYDWSLHAVGGGRSSAGALMTCFYYLTVQQWQAGSLQ
jgi:hypothetical protein